MRMQIIYIALLGDKHLNFSLSHEHDVSKQLTMRREHTSNIKQNTTKKQPSKQKLEEKQNTNNKNSMITESKNKQTKYRHNHQPQKQANIETTKHTHRPKTTHIVEKQ